MPNAADICHEPSNSDVAAVRYRCLDAIVKAVFPGDATETAFDLWQLGQRMGYNMPDITHQGGSQVNLAEIIKPKPEEQAASSIPAPEPQPANSSHPLSTVPAARDQTLPRCSSAEDNVRLVKDTAGGEHYIGPSGSLQFLAQLRRLLSSQNGNVGHGSEALSTRFTQDDTAQALEADSAHTDAEEQTSTLPSRQTDHAVADGQSPGSINSSIAQDFTKPSAEDVQAGQRELPSPETMDLLLRSYWKHAHQDYPLFHRGTFEEEYEVFLKQSNHMRPPASTTDAPSCDWGWVACLRMMLVFGSLSDPHVSGIDHATLRRQSVASTRRLLPQLVSRCTLSNVRALILVSLFLHNNNERNASWVLLGAAVRAAIALGLHRTSALSSFRPIEREVRKRVFCTLYGFEQFLASSLGRPSGLNDVDIEVSPPKGGLLGESNADGDQLMDISSSLHQILARARVLSEKQNNHGTSVADVLDSLEAWHCRVSANRSRYIPPIKLGIPTLDSLGRDAMHVDALRTPLGWQDPAHLRETLLLHAEFRYIGLLVTRPALLKEVAASRSQNRTSTLSAESSRSQSTICLWNACQLAQIILLLESFDLLNGVSSLDVFYAYSAAMVLILGLLRRPGLLTRSNEPDGQEDEIQTSLHDLVSRLKGAVTKVEKSGTMRRFALVMTTFEECVSPRQPPWEPSGSITAGAGALNREMQVDSSHYLHDPLFIAGAAPTTVASQSHIPPGGGIPFAGIAGLATVSGWPNAMRDPFGGMSDGDFWMGPGVSMNTNGSPLEPVEWLDVESLLAAHIVPSWE